MINTSCSAKLVRIATYVVMQ